MAELFRWTPTVVAVASLVGMGFVLRSTVNRHEAKLDKLEETVQELDKKVAVLEATTKGA